MLRLLAFFAIVLSAAGAAITGTVSGLVVNDADRQPVAKAAVVLTSVSSDRSFGVAITDGSGRFQLPGIPAGRYSLRAERNGFAPVAYGAVAPQRPGTVLSLAAGEQRAAITLHVVPRCSIRGTVMDGEGDPVAGVSVSLYVRQYQRGAPHYLSRGGSMTNERGQYELAGLVPGSYWVMAQGRFLPALRTHPVVIAGEQIPVETTARQFYTHADSPERATPVIVSAGQDAPNIDFQLEYVPQVSLHGVVTGIPEGARSVSLRLEPESDLLSQQDEPRIQVNPSHPEYQIAGLTPGSYRMVVQGGSRRAVVPVRLSGKETELNVALLPGTVLNGLIHVEGPDADKLRQLRIGLSSGDLAGSDRSLRADVKGGQFSFPEVPAGIWDIGVTPLPRGAYIKSMRLGSKDVLLEDMEIGPGTKDSLTIVVSTAAPKVEGTVDAAGPATVLAAPSGQLAQIFSLYAVTQVGEKGRFTFNGLNPGTYRFYAFRELEPRIWEETAFLPQFEVQSKSVELREGATETLSLSLIETAKP